MSKRGAAIMTNCEKMMASNQMCHEFIPCFGISVIDTFEFDTATRPSFLFKFYIV
jgi:hypothetical protein